jgi:hypothetical protein
MFARFRTTSRRLQVSIVETRRIDDKVRHKHIAGLGAASLPLSPETRLQFWQKLYPRLARLDNRLDGEAQAKILGTIRARIPVVTGDERRALQLAVTSPITRDAPMSESDENKESSAQRLASVAELIRESFSTAVEQGGEAEARRLWVEVLNDGKRKRGRPRRSSLSGWDALLLAVYDGMKDDPNPETLVRYLGIFFHQQFDSKQYHSAQAVERRLRRLLADRAAGKLLREETGGALGRYTVVPRSRGQ